MITYEDAERAIWAYLWDALAALTPSELPGLPIRHAEDAQAITEARAGILIKLARLSRGLA